MKQDQLIEELRNNQFALERGFDNVIGSNKDVFALQRELPQIEPEQDEAKKDSAAEPRILDVGNDFNDFDRFILEGFDLKKTRRV